MSNPRFYAEQVGDLAWQVHDRDAAKYNMPVKAVSINLSKQGAYIIAADLNMEWRMFENNPN